MVNDCLLQWCRVLFVDEEAWYRNVATATVISHDRLVGFTRAIVLPGVVIHAGLIVAKAGCVSNNHSASPASLCMSSLCRKCAATPRRHEHEGTILVESSLLACLGIGRPGRISLAWIDGEFAQFKVEIYGQVQATNRRMATEIRHLVPHTIWQTRVERRRNEYVEVARLIRRKRRICKYKCDSHHAEGKKAEDLMHSFDLESSLSTSAGHGTSWMTDDPILRRMSRGHALMRSCASDLQVDRIEIAI